MMYEIKSPFSVQGEALQCTGKSISSTVCSSKDTVKKLRCQTPSAHKEKHSSFFPILFP